jgi:hypothetical protein
MSTRMPNEESNKDVNREQEQQGQGQPLGQKPDNTGRDRKKRTTVQFDEGQKFTSDEDIIRRRTA